MSCTSNFSLRPSPLCLSVVKSAEGYRSTAYLDDKYGKVWTIGFGHTEGVKQGDTCTQDQANAWLVQDLASSEAVVKRAVNVPLSQGQYDALVSFVFNVGPGTKDYKSGFVTLRSGAPSTMLRLINAGDFENAANEFDKWTKDEGVTLPGLVKRRTAEKTLFLES